LLVTFCYWLVLNLSPFSKVILGTMVLQL